MVNTGNIGKTWGQPFQKGVSGNPGGKAKGSVSLVARVKRALKKRPPGERSSYADRIALRVVKDAADGDRDAIALVFKYVEGLPVASLPEGATAGLMFMVTAPPGVEEPDIIDAKVGGRELPPITGVPKPLALGPGDISPDSDRDAEP